MKQWCALYVFLYSYAHIMLRNDMEKYFLIANPL